MKSYLFRLGKKAKKASIKVVKSKNKDKVLNDYCNLLLKNQSRIISENKKDLKKANEKKLKENLVKRLSINERKIFQIINSIKKIIKLKDPVNFTLKNGKDLTDLKLKRLQLQLV